MSNITYAVYNGEAEEGGVYNVLASFLRGLLKGFKEANIDAYTYEECVKNNINFEIAIGFNLAGANNWQKVISENKINIIWSVDSIFAQNAPLFKKCQDVQNVIVFGVAPADYEASKRFLPNLKYMYIPHATDKDLWKKEHLKKENDIVFLSSLYDFENKLENIKDNKFLYGIVNEFIDMLEKNPNLSFWDVYTMVNKSTDFNLDVDNYTKLYDFVTSIVEQKQKVKIIEAVSDLNVKVYGNELWKKYIKGKVQYMGKADLNESIKIINSSKISLHCQPPQLNYGLHERFLNASSLGTFNLVSNSPSIKNEFKDNFGYYDHSTFEDIEEKALYYLNNEDEREQMAQKAMNITHSNHLWKNRAETIDELFRQ